jgi:phosphotransacetylase
MARFNGGRFYFGTMMVYKDHADGMVSGAAHTTPTHYFACLAVH